MKAWHLPTALVAALALGGAAHAIDLTFAGYSENFDTMGQTGTALPLGWSMWTMGSGSATTHTSFVSPGALGSMVLVGAGLTAIEAPLGTNSNGFNAANIAPAAATDRVVATSPGSGAGMAIQLSMTNTTGVALAGVVISFDIVRYSVASATNELPGYSMLTTIDGNSSYTYTPGLAVVPNTVGTTQIVNLTLAPGFGWLPGRTMQIWWFDDNAQQSAPDQIVGLNNVVLTPTPEPTSALLLAGGLGALGLAMRRRR